jgi:predicted nuclease with RNAse H fold
VLSLGIDVGVRKGLDAVLMDGGLVVRNHARHVSLEALGALLEETRPDVVALDSPPGWAHAGSRSRATERELATLLIRCFATPDKDLGAPNDFYRWMTVGFQAFAVCAAHGYPRHVRGPVNGTALEVFPHASAVVLSGTLPPAGTARRAARKREWRRGVLAMHGVDTTALPSLDQVDAGLAALTGILALQGRFVTRGDPDEGVIVLPVPSLPRHRYTPAGEEVTTR